MANDGVFDEMNERCRTCLATGARFEVFSLISGIELSLAEMIFNCASVQISEDDSLPQRICETCKETAVRSHLFRIQCEASDRHLKSFGQDQITSNKVASSIFEDLVEDFETLGPEETIELVIEDRSSSSDQLEATEPRGAVTGDNKEGCDSDVKRRTCPFCDKLFQHRTSMLKHQRKHSSAPRTCPYCPFQPSSPSRLSRHMEQAHSHLKTVTCSLCGKSFFKKANLHLHQQTHSGVKKHTCEVCGLSFVLRGNLSVHRRLHTGEKPYTCSACGRGFAQQSALRSHEASHSDRRDHACKECGAAFSRAGALRNHQKRHLDAREFECGVCGRKFTFSSERKRHMRVHSGDKDFECEVCGRRFSRNANLKVHRRIHTGETPHVCGVCGKGFVQAHCLRTHMNTHGKGGE